MFKKLFFLIFSIGCYSQNEFQILQSETLEKKKISNEKFEIFSGNVIAKHKQIILYCDTMLISQKNNFVQAWSDEKTILKDTNDFIIESKQIFFFKSDSIINFKNEVFGQKKKQKIFTEDLSYNLKQQIAYFINKGTVEDENYIVNSDNCEYNLKNKTANFKYNIELESEDLSILSNNIEINRLDNIIHFNSRTQIKKDSLIIEGDKGSYSKKNKSLELFGNIIVNQNEKINVYSDNLKDNDSISVFTINPKLIINPNKDDSFMIKGEKIIINQIDSLLSVINNVFMKNDSIKGKCNKYLYELKSNKVSLINDPVLFINKQQITGDTIFLYTKDETIDSIYIPNNAFLSSKKFDNYYNQIKGKVLKGKFYKNKIQSMNITGNSEFKYFNEKDDEIDGINEIISDEINIYFADSEIDKINFNGQPDANYIPINLINKDELFLDGFLIRDSVYK